MKIGLTGGTGFIGQHLLKDYADRHTFVAATSRENTGGFYQHPNIQYVFSNYSITSFCAAFAECDCIVHLGAAKSSAGAEKKIENFYCNISACENIFYAAHSLGIKNVINISSRCVYEPSLPKPFKEELTAPLNRYGAAKLCTENIAAIFNRSCGMKIKSLRLAQVLGSGMRSGDLLSVYLERSLKGKPLEVFGRGESAKEYIYIKDVTAAIMCACLKKSLGGSFNIGTGTATTNLNLAQAFCSVFRNEGGYRLLPEKQEDGLVYCMDVSRAKETLGFCAEYDLCSALVDMKKELEVTA